MAHFWVLFMTPEERDLACPKRGPSSEPAILEKQKPGSGTNEGGPGRFEFGSNVNQGGRGAVGFFAKTWPPRVKEYFGFFPYGGSNFSLRKNNLFRFLPFSMNYCTQ